MTNSASLLVQIDGRDAIPLRAVPYVIGWEVVPPDLLLKLLARHGAVCGDSNLSAHRIVDGIPKKVLPKEWHTIVVGVNAISAEIHLKQANHAIGEATWQRESLLRLPADAFVWKDELEGEILRGDIPPPTESIAKKGDWKLLNFSPLLPDIDLRKFIVADLGSGTLPHDDGIAENYAMRHDLASQVEHAAAWWAAEMDAAAWWAAESISPVNAAMLLSRLNPNTVAIADADTTSSDEMAPDDFRRLRNVFEGAPDGRKTLQGWTAYARERDLKIHSWIESWEAWIREGEGKPSRSDNPAPSKTKPMMQQTIVEVTADTRSQIGNWKMRVQAEATARCLRLYAAGANPTISAIKGDLATWCRDNNVLTETGIAPSAEYLRVHVLSGKHWRMPDRPRKSAEQVEQAEQAEQAQLNSLHTMRKNILSD